MVESSDAHPGSSPLPKDQKQSSSDGAGRPIPVPLPWVTASPTGTVTFLFSGIEGSTPRWERNPQAMEAALGVHNQVLESAITAQGGMVFKIIGDEFQVVFPTAPGADC